MHRHDASCFVHTYPLFHSMWWYVCHACLRHPLVLCASLHACLHVHAWALLANVSSMLQCNEAMDIQSKRTFVPHKHHLLFAILFVYPLLFVCYLACLSLCLLVHFAPFFYYQCFSPYPLLCCWFLVFAFACTHMEWGHMELGHDLLGTSKKGTDASLPTWVQWLCSVGLGFSFSFWLCTLLYSFLPPPFLP